MLREVRILILCLILAVATTYATEVKEFTLDKEWLQCAVSALQKKYPYPQTYHWLVPERAILGLPFDDGDFKCYSDQLTCRTENLEPLIRQIEDESGSWDLGLVAEVNSEANARDSFEKSELQLSRPLIPEQGMPKLIYLIYRLPYRTGLMEMKEINGKPCVTLILELT